MARVDTLPTWTEVDGDPGVVAEGAGGNRRAAAELAATSSRSSTELVELQATATAATSDDQPSAARRVFHDAEPKAPP